MSDDPENDRSRARARADFDPHRDPQGRPGLYVQIADEPSADVARRVRALSAALHRDREQSFVRMLAARPGWLSMVPYLPSLRARRRDQLRRSALGVAVTLAVCVGWILAAAWRAWL